MMRVDECADVQAGTDLNCSRCVHVTRPRQDETEREKVMLGRVCLVDGGPPTLFCLRHLSLFVFFGV